MNQSGQKLPGSFGWLNATQFLGALNDNLFKLFVVFTLIATQGPESEIWVQSVAGMLFAVPFLLLLSTAGVLADRVSKRTVIVWVKVCETAVMVAGVAALAIGSRWFLFAALFLMAGQSAIFGPSKYGIVPELVGKERLSKANGHLQAFTYLAIIIGTVSAPALGLITDKNYALAACASVLISAVGVLCALQIKKTPAAGGTAQYSLFFLRDLWRTYRKFTGDGYLMLAVLASAFFLMIAVFFQLNIIPFGRQVLGWDPENSTFLFLLTAFGIGSGALTSGRVSGRNIEFGLVPLGAFGLCASTLSLALVSPEPVLIGVLLFIAGFSAGIFIVPLQAFIQFRSPKSELGEILAASSFLSWIGAMIGSGMLFLFGEGMGLSAQNGYLIVGLLTLAMTLGSFLALPDFLLRFLVMLISRLFYRVRVVGHENLPVDGPALLLPNHASWADAILLISTQPRRIRFLMSREMYNTMGIWRIFLKFAGVIPVSGHDSRQKIDASLTEARVQLDQGFVVCLFPEGGFTMTGMIRPFKSVFARIVKDSGYPIIPVYLGGVWGSIFSHYYGAMASRLPTKLRYPVTIVFGEPMPPDTPPFEARMRVQELSCDYFEDKRPNRRSLPEVFVRRARSRWMRTALMDSTGKRLRFGQALISSLVLKEGLRHRLGDDEYVGILLPPSVGGALTNIAVSMLGKVTVNLNFTASQAAFQSAIDQCGIKKIISARAFLDRLDVKDSGCEFVELEEVLRGAGAWDKIRAALRATLYPAGSLVNYRNFHGDSLAAILFSSGSTGSPKGVMLSHHNIQSNVEASDQLLRLNSNDTLCGALPLFHALGYTCTMWLPLLSGCAASYHPNPLDGAGIAKMVRRNSCTILVSTPTFLVSYMRRANAADFSTLRHCIAGAEKLKPKLADSFEEKFGVRPLEGYGATELSPLACVNVPNVERYGRTIMGTKPGSIGQPIPGVAVSVRNPETGEPVPHGEEGVMWIRGPNVMIGYLHNPEATREVLQDGWYNTSDVAYIDRDGFITITDRLARFSKIGGEMVPHVAVEDALLGGLDTEERVLAVTAVPDEKRGERLVVLHTADSGGAEKLQQILQVSDLPNLWRPSPKSFYEVADLPVLATGKLDLGAVRKLAADLDADSRQ